MSRSVVSTNKIKEHLNSAVFRTFFANHDTQTELTVRRLLRNSNKYLSNIEDKNIHSIAASMIIVHAIECDPSTYSLIMENPRSEISAISIITEAKKNVTAVMAIENKTHKKSTQVEYLAVVKRIVTEYFVSKRGRIHTDNLIEKLKDMKVYINLTQEYYPWRYIKSIDSIIERLEIRDMPEIGDEFDDIQNRERFEILAEVILSSGGIDRIRSIIESDLSS